ncbi:MAG: glycogen/starch/alpha-glucan phosphorylase, partial [Oscillospiraceae bacterium]|nr:glycogen/starch/alpha-glucan phosphorylase [Oscillospiraceae bacterium]
MEKFTKESMKQAIADKLRINFGCDVEEADRGSVMKACAMVLRDRMSINAVDTRSKIRKKQLRQVHYMSLEFLMGRSLMKNAYNLGVLEPMRAALEDMGFKPGGIFDMEPDAGLGNGGLGRLAACYMDSLATLEIPACGYSICYELGIFRQRIVDGQQMELPDNWKDQGDAWLIPKPDEVEEVHFGGTLREFWDGDRLHVVNEGYTRVLAVPCDMSIAGYDTKHTNTLRLWDAKSPTPIDMSAFNQGDYLRAGEERAMAEAIAKVLYPEDNHYEGKSLRLRQQYFFVSATVQSIVRKHIQAYGTVANFHEKNVIQINDTHPALVIPELMRILMDDAGLDWETSWHITANSVAYTNHTVLAEALERWPQDLMKTLLPRIWQILCEIARRWQVRVEEFYHDEAKTRNMAVIWDGEVRMANLCIAGGMAVNGVSALHSDILRNDVFKDACGMEPGKFKNVTNGIDHRRWLAEINPGLDSLIRDLTGGDDYLRHPGTALPKLDKFAKDKEVLTRLGQIKHANKLAFAKFAKREQGVIVNTDAIFDVQVKRLHEYKRQLLNVMHIVHLYLQLRDNPNMELRPHTFLFGAKAAPGYAVAKRIIRLINSLADQVNNDPICKDKLQVFFMENYRVSMAEVLMPASEVSQQISTAGKEASGTGNMKFMMNGALT